MRFQSGISSVPIHRMRSCAAESVLRAEERVLFISGLWAPCLSESSSLPTISVQTGPMMATSRPFFSLRAPWPQPRRGKSCKGRPRTRDRSNLQRKANRSTYRGCGLRPLIERAIAGVLRFTLKHIFSGKCKRVHWAYNIPFYFRSRVRITAIDLQLNEI